MKTLTFLNRIWTFNTSSLAKLLTLLVFQILLLGPTLSNAQESTSSFIQGADTLIVYKDIPGQAPSDKYTLRVRSAATNNEWVDVYANYTYNRNFELPQDRIMFGGNINYHYQIKTDGWSHSFGNIEMSRGTEVEVEIAYKGNFQFNGQPITKAAAHPAHTVSKQPEIKDGKIYFTINKPGQVYIDINGQMDDYHYAINPLGGSVEKPYGIPLHAISLFANPVIYKPSLEDPNVAVVEPGVMPSSELGNKTTLYFKPGVHNIGMNFKLYPNKKYYIPGDAIIYGTMNNMGVSAIDNVRAGENIKIFGYGTISHYGIHHPLYAIPAPVDDNEHCPIFITDAINTEVYGVSIMDPSMHSLKLQASTSRPDKNKMETICRWIKIVSWRSNGDGIGSAALVEDCFLRTTDDASYLKGSRIRTIFWRDIHAAGFHMAGTPGADDSFPLIVEDCDAIYLRSRDAEGFNGGIFHNRGEGIVGHHTVNVTVRNFRSEDKLANSPFFNMYSKSDKGDIGSSYKGINFQNINIESDRIKQVLTGCAEAPWDGGITFDNVTIKGTLLTEANFNTYFITNEFTKNIIFKNSANYSFNITNPENGSIIPGSNLPGFIEGTVISLTAVPDAGYEFVSWSGDVSGTENPLDVVMNSDKTVSATFRKASFFVFETPGSGTWTVPQGVNSITLKAWGGGGAGGSAYSGVATANTQARAGGGAGGSFAGATISVTPGQVINYTIGAGGMGSPSGFEHLSKSASGETTLATLNSSTVVLAFGGTGGENVSVTNMVYGGVGGLATTSGNIGDIIFYGGNGGTAGPGGSGGGGGSAGAEGPGGNGALVTPGTAGLGGGAAGGTGTNLNAQLPTNGNAPGGGGGGAVVRNNLDAAQNNMHRTGAKGANGRLEIILNNGTSVSTSDVNPDFSVYPNPAYNELFINTTEFRFKRIELISFTGKVLYSINSINQNQSIDISGLTSGIYFIKAHSANGIFTSKIIKK